MEEKRNLEERVADEVTEEVVEVPVIEDIPLEERRSGEDRRD